MKVFYSPAYVAAGEEFDTTRKAGWIADSLTTRPIPGVEVVAPVPVTAQELSLVHDASYVDAVRTGKPRYWAESQGFAWDEGLWAAVTASTGGVRAAASTAALDRTNVGTLSSGLHHARRDSGAGFCTFNGLALAAKMVLDAGLAKRVLILDLDAHCGGGTSDIIGSDPRIWQADVSTSAFDVYSVPEARGTLRLVGDAADYIDTIDHVLYRLQGESFDLVIYNAGMDPYEHCEIGGLAGITKEVLAEREQLVFGHFHELGVPVAFTLAGGYVNTEFTPDELVDLHRLTITEAAKWA